MLEKQRGTGPIPAFLILFLVWTASASSLATQDPVAELLAMLQSTFPADTALTEKIRDLAFAKAKPPTEPAELLDLYFRIADELRVLERPVLPWLQRSKSWFLARNPGEKGFDRLTRRLVEPKDGIHRFDSSHVPIFVLFNRDLFPPETRAVVGLFDHLPAQSLRDAHVRLLLNLMDRKLSHLPERELFFKCYDDIVSFHRGSAIKSLFDFFQATHAAYRAQQPTLEEIRKTAESAHVEHPTSIGDVSGIFYRKDHNGPNPLEYSPLPGMEFLKIILQHSKTTSSESLLLAGDVAGLLAQKVEESKAWAKTPASYNRGDVRGTDHYLDVAPQREHYAQMARALFLEAAGGHRFYLDTEKDAELVIKVDERMKGAGISASARGAFLKKRLDSATELAGPLRLIRYLNEDPVVEDTSREWVSRNAEKILQWGPSPAEARDILGGRNVHPAVIDHVSDPELAIDLLEGAARARRWRSPAELESFLNRWLDRFAVSTLEADKREKIAELVKDLPAPGAVARALSEAYFDEESRRVTALSVLGTRNLVGAEGVTSFPSKTTRELRYDAARSHVRPFIGDGGPGDGRWLADMLLAAAKAGALSPKELSPCTISCKRISRGRARLRLGCPSPISEAHCSFSV